MVKIIPIIVSTVILLTAFLSVKIEAQTAEKMESFFDSEVPGIRIIVNATSETQPNGNVSVSLGMYPLGGVKVNITSFSFTIYGYDEGKVKTPIENKTLEPFSPPLEYNFTFTVPENVWGTTHGEIVLTYVAETALAILPIKDLKCGFPMTVVRNVAFEKLQEDYKKLNESYALLNNSYWQLRTSYEELNQTFFENFQMNLTSDSLEALNSTLQELRASQNELSNTRTVVTVLAVTTVSFLATTTYLILRKPKDHY
jgi:hypothetical protein